MTGIVLHHVPASRSFRVLWMLEELGLEAEVRRYSIRAGDMRAPEVMAVTPAGRAPGLEIDGIAMFESGAILEYLAETRPEAGLGRAPGHPERARYLSLIHFAETMASLIENLNLSHVFLRPPARPSVPVLKVTTARLKGTLAALEGMLGEDGFLLDGGFSAADVMLGFNLWAAPRYVRLDPFPRVRAYRDRLAARPAFAAARARDGAAEFYDRDFYEIPDD
ncbi:MAG: glutathione S-transferase family protein [Hasllibacter sp.]